MPTWKHAFVKRIQRLVWIYVTDNFHATSASALSVPKPALPCTAVRITGDNCARVLEFRDDASRVNEYAAKVAANEIGLFAEAEGQMVGSIWATVNDSPTATVARGYMPLLPGEAMIHDIVTGERQRGLGIGAFMLERMVVLLCEEYHVTKTIIDVNFRNTPSLRMMNRAGLRKVNRVLYISALRALVFAKVLKQYPC